jgi:IS5 family transposase
MSAKKQVGQPGFADAVTAGLGGKRTTAFLETLDAKVPWEKLAAAVERLYQRPAGTAGAPHYPATLMLKATMLAKWYNLSDPQLEEQLRDRFSFRRFVGLALSDPTPDETSFVLFRRLLRESGLEKALFHECLAYLKKENLLVKEGTLIDATILEAPAPRKQSDGTKKGGDPEASYTLKAGQIHYGYKGYIATDRRALVKDYHLDTAKTHEVKHLLRLARKERHAVFADSASRDRKRQARLHRRGVLTFIMPKRERGQKKLTGLQKRVGRLIASVRAAVERPFAWMKNRGYWKVRYRGRERNSLDLGLTLMAHNLAVSLKLAAVDQPAWSLNLPRAVAAR